MIKTEIRIMLLPGKQLVRTSWTNLNESEEAFAAFRELVTETFGHDHRIQILGSMPGNKGHDDPFELSATQSGR